MDQSGSPPELRARHAFLVGEGGGIFALDRNNGQCLWATPFPFDVPQFLISNIDGKTGKVNINHDLVLKQAGEHVICFFDTREATGLRSKEQLAVRALHRQLPGHDARVAG